MLQAIDRARISEHRDACRLRDGFDAEEFPMIKCFTLVRPDHIPAVRIESAVWIDADAQMHGRLAEREGWIVVVVRPGLNVNVEAQALAGSDAPDSLIHARFVDAPERKIF